MTPEAASQIQIERYRKMTGEERLLIALRLHELSCEVAREGIRSQFPGASKEEVERKLAERIRLSYTTEPKGDIATYLEH
jgi:Rv0078B-related antitoxin